MDQEAVMGCRLMSAGSQGQTSPGGEVGPYALAKGTLSPEIGLRPGRHQVLQQAPNRALRQEHERVDTVQRFALGQQPRLNRQQRIAAAWTEEGE